MTKEVSSRVFDGLKRDTPKYVMVVRHYHRIGGIRKIIMVKHMNNNVTFAKVFKRTHISYWNGRTEKRFFGSRKQNIVVREGIVININHE